MIRLRDASGRVRLVPSGSWYHHVDNADKWRVVRNVRSLFLVEPMRIRDDLLANGLITDEEYCAMSWSSRAETRHLFQYVLPKRGANSFERFVSILEQHHELQFVAEEMLQAVYGYFGSLYYNGHSGSLGYLDQFISREDQSVYTKALASGSIPVNRYRLMVVGKDGAGKSCFMDSLLDRPFKPVNPSTDGIAIDVAVTAAEGRKGHDAWAAHEVHKGQYLDKYFAAGYVITRKREKRANFTRSIIGEPVDTFNTVTEFEIGEKVKWTVPASQGENPQTEMNKYERNSPEQRESCDVAELDYIDQITKEEKLTEKQQQMVVDYLESNEALSSLENYEVNEVSTKLLWDLGGQETYLTTHAALMPTESLYTVCAYLLAIDISIPLGDHAKSSFRGNTQSQDLSLTLSSLLYNRDFPRHWFTSICISHPSDVTSPYLGEDLGVKYPPILIGATHMDKVRKLPNCEEFLKTQNEELDKLIRNLKCEDHIVRPDDADIWFFPIDNTKSGQGDNPRCEGVKAIGSKLDVASMQYWSEKTKRILCL